VKINTTLFSIGLLAAALLMLTTGCGTKYHTLKITTDPTGADVVFDGKTQSNTPTAVAMPKDGRDHYLFIGKTGCEEIRKVFSRNAYPQSLDLVLDCEPESTALADGGEIGSGPADGAGLPGAGDDSSVAVDTADGRPMDRERFVNDDIYFAYDSSVLSADAQMNLKRKARWLKANPNIAFIIEGHTDERGTGAYNLALGDRRAQRTMAFLKDLGITEDRMLTVSFGEERPAVTGAGEQVWSLNRRVHTAIE